MELSLSKAIDVDGVRNAITKVKITSGATSTGMIIGEDAALMNA